jgi:hypothetical protein
LGTGDFGNDSIPISGASVGREILIPDFINAVSRLNSWVRSKSAKENWGAPARAIYYLKSRAIEWADMNMVCLHSTVKVRTQCRDCKGTGKYLDSYGELWPHCRACGSRGMLSLLFVQTHISGGPIWHTPWNRFWIHRKKSPAYQLARWVEDWSVNEPGHDMKPWELCRDFNLVETTFTSRPDWYSTDWGQYHDFLYSINLGVRKPVCEFCPAFEHLHRFCVFQRPISWTAWVCDKCHRSKPLSSEDFGKPEDLIDNSHIVKFIERRTAENVGIEIRKQRAYA